MLHCFVHTKTSKMVPIQLILPAKYSAWLSEQSDFVQTWLQNITFKAESGNVAVVPHHEGQISFVICVTSASLNMWDVGHLPQVLPEGLYFLSENTAHFYFYALAWGLGAYQFTRYKKPKRAAAQLYLPETEVKIAELIEAIYEVRDWINIPTEDLGPSEFSNLSLKMAEKYNAKWQEIKGETLLQENYPCIYAVGRASDDEPRLIELRWGNPAHPKVTLVGKGVCFDTGGLDIKVSPYMLLMKKDMAGAAHVLGLARMLMQAKLAISLRVLMPVVENVISGNAYKPGDIIKSRKGLTIEIGNTDAEGRLVLADALTEAVSEKPDLIIDISTLTGAARVALGPEVPVVFSNNDKLVQNVIEHGEFEQDIMWRLPLYAPYREYLNSPIADINNCSTQSYAGAITAALFLKEFVPDDIPWLHFDIMAWNLSTRPGRPQGGEAMGLRALFNYLKEKYGAAEIQRP